jgi:hypothetical protein
MAAGHAAEQDALLVDVHVGGVAAEGEQAAGDDQQREQPVERARRDRKPSFSVIVVVVVAVFIRIPQLRVAAW